jgi:signal recognition particle subunit SEC65
MMKKNIFLTASLSIIIFTYAYSNDDAFHAVSSLCSIIEDFKNNPDSTPDDQEMAELWDAAADIENPDLVEQAKYFYEKSFTTPRSRNEQLMQAAEQLEHLREHSLAYPNFDRNPLIDDSMKKLMAPYLIPLNHPAKVILDRIFSRIRVTESLDSMIVAGFEILFIQQSSYIIVAKHPALPGYLFKIYLDSEVRRSAGRTGWQCLTDRCIGVERIKKLIKKKKIKYFVTPEKWLYPLPVLPTAGPIHQPVVLLVTNMNLVSDEKTQAAWKTVPTQALLKELYYILSNGSGSWFLTGNVPYTKSGKFTFIDTEYPKREIRMHKVKDFIDPSMHAYWDKLVKKGR